MEEYRISREEFNRLFKMVEKVSETVTNTRETVIRMETQLKYLDNGRLATIEKAIDDHEERLDRIQEEEIEALRGDQQAIKRAAYSGIFSIILGYLADIFFLRGGKP